MTIDWWTLGIQAVNIMILVWLLGRFFWRPVAGMVEQRREAALSLLGEVETKRRQVTDALAENERTRAGFAREREAILAAARNTAEQAHAARLDEAAKAVATQQAAATAAIEKDRQDAEKAWAVRATHLAVAIVERLAARLGGAAVRAAFAEWLLKEIRALPESARQAMGAPGAVLEAISATPLDAADQEHCRELIGQALGTQPQITFRTDPALIAGLELHGPHVVVSNSWRADLDKILAELTHDNRR